MFSARAFLFLACLIMLSGCNSGNSSSKNPAEDQLIVLDSVNQREVAISPMDCTDETNKYKSLYGEWDIWLEEHLVDMAEAGSPYWEQFSPDAFSMYVYFDDSGCMVPQTVYAREVEEARKFANDSVLHPDYLMGIAIGDIPEELREQMESAIDKVVEPFYPEIPDWLASNPPKGASVYPNGDIVTYGKLGDGSSEDGMLDYTSVDEVCLFDNSGTLLNTAEGNNLWFLYYDPWTNGFPPGEFSNRIDGYVIFKDAETQDILSVYDYDGQLLPDNTEPEDRDQHNFLVLGYNQVKRLHEAQTH